MGAGPAGNSIAQAAKHLGASRVVVTDRARVPLALAGRIGIDAVVDVGGLSKGDVIEQLMAFAPGGYATVFDSIGTQESFSLGLEVTAKQGTFVEMAIHDAAFSGNFLSIGSERSVTTCCNFSPRDFPWALNWLEAGRFAVKDWLTRASLADVPRLFEQSRSGERPAFKLLIEV